MTWNKEKKHQKSACLSFTAKTCQSSRPKIEKGKIGQILHEIHKEPAELLDKDSSSSL
jgi:hypothetical protein